MIITIDGPVASGKSTVAQTLANDLGYYYLYTGLLYRGIAYALVSAYGYDEAQLKAPRHADIDQLLSAHRLVYDYINNSPNIIFDGTNITAQLKTKEVDNWSSISSADPYVRAAILHLQVSLGKQHDVVADGRDTGTVVFPHAEHKFFLTASTETRAARWQKDQARAGKQYTLAECITIISERDNRDVSRTHSPLIPAQNAVIVDNSERTIQQTVDYMKHAIAQK